MSEEKRPKYWLHRITGGKNALKLSHPLLFKREDKLISIGWAYLAAEDPTFLSDVKNGGLEAFEKYFKDKPVNRHFLWRFIHEMKKGDIVVVPSWGEFSIYEIADDELLTINNLKSIELKAWYDEKVFIGKDGYLHDSTDARLDLGFFRRVNKLEEHLSPRSNYAAHPLELRMKVRQTTVDITTLREYVDQARARKEANNPISLKKEVLNETLKKVHALISTYVGTKGYEELVGKYLAAIGGEVEDTSREGTPTDKGDADRVATFEDLKLKVCVQVKKHDGATPSWAVDQIANYADNFTEEGYYIQKWVISNADEFTNDAKEKAQNRGVRLINGEEFARMILDVGLKHFE